MAENTFIDFNFSIPKATPIHLRRLCSSILAEFPWRTEEIIARPVPVYRDEWGPHEFCRFTSALHEFEQHLLSFNAVSEGSDYLPLLGVQHHLTTSHSTDIALTATHKGWRNAYDFGKICEVLTAYRLYEVIGLSAGFAHPRSSSSPSPCMYLPPGGPKNKSLLFYSDLKKWDSVVYDFCRVVKEASNDPLPFNPDASPLVSLVRMVEANNVKSGYYAIMENFLYVSLEIAAMKYIPFRPGTLPLLPSFCPPCPNDMPDRREYEEFVSAYNALVSPARTGRFSSVASRNIRNAMHLSALVSPLYLIFPFRHSERNFPWWNILDHSSRLGRRSEGIALKIETEIWSSAFRLSSGKGAAEPILYELAEKLSSILENHGQLTEDEKSCFVLPDRVPYKLPSETMALVQIVPKTVGSSTDTTPLDVHLPTLPLPTLLQHLTISPTPLQNLTIGLPPSHTPGQLTTLSDSTLNAIMDVFRQSMNPSSSTNIPPATGCTGKDLGINVSPLESTGTVASPLTFTTEQPFPRCDSPSALFEAYITMPLRSSDSIETDSLGLPGNELYKSTEGDESTNPPNEGEHDVGAIDINSRPATLSNQDKGRATIGPEHGGDDDNEQGGVDGEGGDREPAGNEEDGQGENEDNRRGGREDGEQRCNKDGVLGGQGVDNRMHNDADPDAYRDDNEVDMDARGDNDNEETDADGDDDDDEERGDLGERNDSENTSEGEDTPKTTSGSSCRKSTRSKKTPAVVPDDSDVDMDPPPTLKRKRSPSAFPGVHSTVRLNGSGSSEDPINVDALCSIFDPADMHDYVPSKKISLDPELVPQIPSKESYVIYNAIGEPIVITPSFHSTLFHLRFDQFMRRVQQYYHHAIPRHVGQGGSSIISTFTYDFWMNLTSRERQLQIASRNVVVTGWPKEKNIIFDEDGLKKVAGTYGRQISIQDYSITPVDDHCTAATVSGRIRDLWENRGPKGKILNTLEFPIVGGDINVQEYTSDLHAWYMTLGHHNVPSDSTYPAAHMRWSLVGLQNAINFLHLDCEGLSTYVDVLCGGTYWIFLHERENNPLSSPAFFIKQGFYLERVLDSSDYDFEAVALQLGDRLFMMPNQPHLVYTYEDSICNGGHYYLTGCMQETLYGLIHTFVLHKFLTHTTQPSRVFLRRMVLMYHMGFLEREIGVRDDAYSHLPELTNMAGIMNLISACVLVVLGNVLDLRTYRAPTQVDAKGKAHHATLMDCDINTIPPNERFAISYARGVALRLMEWIRSCAVITGPDGNPVSDLPSLYLVQVAKTLSVYKIDSDIPSKHKHSNLFTLDMLESQIANVMALSPNLQQLYSNCFSLPVSLELQDIEKYHVAWVPKAEEWEKGNKSFLRAGWTGFDDRYFCAQRDRCELELGILLQEILNQLFDDPPPKKRKKAKSS